MDSNMVRLRYAIAAWILVFASVAFAADCPEAIIADLTLSGNLVSNASSSDCVMMNASNIVLDCAGYSIIGTSPDDGRYGVYIPGKNNVTIKNCNIWNFSDGIRTSGGVSNSLIQNNTITDSVSGINIYVSGTNANNTITNNIIANTTGSDPYNYGYGIRIYVSSGSATNNNITYNNISGTTLGIYIPGAEDNRIANNIITNTYPIGIALDTNSNGNNVNQNTISYVTYGIQFSLDSDNVVNTGSISNATNGFHFNYATGNTVANVVLNNITGYHIYSNTSSTDNVFLNINGLNKGQLGAAADGNCTIGWYIRANVTNGTDPIEGANVTALNGLGAQAWNATTDSDGLTPWRVTYDGIYGSAVLVNYNNYTFNASNSTVTGNTTYTVASEATVPIVIVTVSSVNVSILPQAPDSFYYPGHEPLINISVNATSPGSSISFVTADFSNISASACNGVPIFNLSSSGGFWIGSCNISMISIAQGTYPSASMVYVTAYNLMSIWSQDTAPVMIHNVGVPIDNDPTNCSRFGSDTTNFSSVDNFGAVNFIMDYEMNFSCATEGQYPNSSWANAALINISSVNLSTEEAAAKLSNLASAIDIAIGEPETFQESRIYINTSYFNELDTNATITLFNLPFTSIPGILSDNSSRQDDIAVLDWSPGYMEVPSMTMGNCYLNTTYVRCSTIPHDYCNSAPYCNWTTSCADIVPSCNAFANSTACVSKGKCLWNGTLSYLPQSSLKFSVSGFSGYNVTKNVSPSITINSPAADSEANATSVLINVTVNGTGTRPSFINLSINDSTDVIYTYIYNASSGLNTANCTAVVPSGETMVCRLLSGTLAKEPYSLTAIAYDFAYPEPGNSATEVSSFEITYTKDAYEPDDDLASARPIDVTGAAQSHNFHSIMDLDYVKFNATAGYIYDILANATVSSPDTEMAVYDENETLLYYSDDIIYGINTNSEIWFKAPYNGTFYVEVDELSGDAGGSYKLSVQKLGIITATITNITKTTMKNGVSFNVTVNATCVGGPCGRVQAALDPILEGANETPKTALEAAAKNGGPINVIVTLNEPEESPKTKKSIYAAQSAVLSTLSSDDFKVKYRYSIVNGFSGTATAAGIKQLMANPNVASVRLTKTYHIMASLPKPNEIIGATSVWNMTANGMKINGTGQTVCILDTGMDYTHPDFGSCTLDDIDAGNCSKIVGGYDIYNDDSDFMDDNGHGSHVSGIVGSIDPTYTGVAPGAKIAMVKVCDSTGSDCPDDSIAAGIEWCMNNSAAYNISVISISIGGSGCAGGDCDGKPCDDDTYLAPYINAASDAGIAVSLASGNEYLGESSPAGIGEPACVKSAISVGATDLYDVIADFANRDQNLDVLAPGVDIISTNWTGGHVSMNGTSMATPRVAGAIALLNEYYLYNYNRTISPKDIDALIKTSGDMISDDAGIMNFSHPRINVLSATAEKGVISTNISARPFYTTSSNPSNSSCYNSMGAGKSCATTWNVRSNGDEGTYGFFAIYGTNYSTYYSTTQNVTIDTTAPTVSLVSPANSNISSSANVTLLFNVTDNMGTGTGINCTIYVDGTARGTSSASNGSTMSYNVSNNPNGVHMWNATCRDAANNTGASASRNFTVDTTNPAISIVSPSQAYYTSGTNILINISATDANIDSIWFFNGTGNETYAAPLARNFSEGMHNITAWANDSAGRMNSTSMAFAVDTINPTIGFVAPTPNTSTYSLNSYLAINASSNDTNFANVTIRLYNSTGGLKNSTFSNSTANLYVDYTGLADGNYSFNATVYDKAGRSNYTETRAVTINTVYPNLTIASPVSAYYYNSTTVLVTLNTSGTGIDTKWFYYNSTLNITYTVPVNVTYANGVQNLIAWVNDTVGHVTAKNVTFTVDTINPTIGITSPLAQIYNTTAVLVNITSGDANLAKTWFFNGTANETYTVPVSRAFTQGQHTLTAWANDSARRMNSTSVIFTVDSIAPTLNMSNPSNLANNSYSQTPFVTVYFVPKDNVDNNITCNVYVDGALNYSVNATNSTQQNYTTSYNDSAHTTSVTCIDDAFNSVSSGTTAFTVDTINPAISFVAPTTNSTSSPNNYIQVNVSASDANLANFVVRVYNASSGALLRNVTLNSSAFYNFTGLGNGTYLFNATAYDRAGNMNKTETRNVTIDTIAPVLAIISPTARIYNSSSVLVNLSASDSTLDTVWFYNGTANETYTVGTPVTRAFTQGQHTLTAWANDTLGHVTTANVTFTVDTTNPAIGIASPVAQAYNVTTILVNITSSDTNLAKTWFSIGAANTTYTKPVNVTFTQGQHTLTAWANDSA
ncbi:MAG: S8 family serine peptidase, partial [Candidatus Micrarchaeota archaeon]|nr:S8 family serine peptidase [Candidatus Micrarchaeota archaeon]